MIHATTLYPKTTDSHFKMEYYMNIHIPMVKSALIPLGLVDLQVDEGLGGLTPGEPPQYAVIAHLVFNTLEEFQGALGTHGPTLMSDIPNFTNVQPVVQISKVAARFLHWVN